MFRAPQIQEDIDPVSGFPRNIFHIPDVNLDKFKKQMAKLSKRSERLLGKPIHALPFGFKTMDLGDGVKRKVYNVILTAEVPRVAGWTFMARLDHANETGTIIRSVPNVGGEIPERFRQSAPICEHCNVNRRRRDTFLLRCDETGEFKQVGSTCLVDFFDGNDPTKIAKMAEYLGYAMEAASAAGVLEGGMADLRWIDVEEFAVHTAAMVRLFGWVSASEAYGRGDEVRATRSRAMDNMVYATTRNIHPVTDEDRAVATEALEWARGLDTKHSLTEWEHSVMVVANAEMMEHRSCGLAASIVGVYLRNKTRHHLPAGERPDYSGSRHMGQPGERLRDVSAKLVGYRAITSDFGVSFLHRFLTADGNILVWFATQGAGLREGQAVTLTGTVKRHEEREGVKQTILNRCKVAAT